jgi:hypothetical protein
MTLPVTDFPAFASNANYATGPDVGTPTKVVPPAPADGFVPETAAVPQYVNYLFENIKQHITYLRNLAAEAFTWTGVHTWSNTVGFGGTVFSTNEIAYTAPKTRRVMLSPAQFFPNTTSTVWTLSPNGGGEVVWAASATVSPDLLVGTSHVPNGAIVTNVRLGLATNVTVDNGEWKAWRSSHDRSTGAPTYTQLGTTTSIAYTGLHVENQGGAISGASGTFAETDWLVVELATGTGGAGTIQLLWAEIEYTELRATGSN